MVPGAVVEVGDATFTEVVERSRLPVLVDFTAAWCAPCKVLGRTLEGLARDLAGRVTVASLDVDRHQATAQRFGVRAMPTLLLFRDGKVVRQLLGNLPRARLEEALRGVA